MSSTNEAFNFVGSQGTTLSGRLHRPGTETANAVKGSILLAHCFTCSKDLHTMSRLAGGLADAGYVALRFDFTGLGQSDGNFAETSVSANVSDLTRAAASLIEAGFGPCGLIGHSLGGAAAVLAAARLKTVRSLVTIGAPADTAHVRHLLSDSLSDLDAGRPATVDIAGRRFDLEPGFVSDLGSHNVLTSASELDRPYCVVHAKDDAVVGFENAVALHDAAMAPKRLAALDTGGHLFGGREHAEELLDTIVDWFGSTL